MTEVDSWQGATILASTSTDDELVGKTLNDTYTVERLLGEGGMGRVYLARHTRIQQKRVAVKVLHREYVCNADALARFQREAETAASISHPNVVAVYDVDHTQSGLPYLVSEYLEGVDLGQYLKREKRLSEKTAIHVARQLCDGLAAAHRCGVIHRDLKPSNVFLVGDFSAGVPELPFVKILDFGLSKFVAAPYGQLVTAAGIVMGTPAFMPPEQAQGLPADHRADIYGVGALLYTFLTGKLPFDEVTPQATVLAVISSEPVRPRAVEPSIAEPIEQIILRAMAKTPEARYGDMQALLEALTIQSGPLKTGPNSRPSLAAAAAPPDSSRESNKPARFRLAMVIGLALAILGGSIAVAVTGFEQASGWALNRRELGLVLTCSAAIAVTPIALLVRWIRRRVWGENKRVFELASAAQTALVTAVSTYGLVWFASRLFNAVILRLMGKPVQIDLGWPGWDFLLPLIGMGAGLLALMREHALSGISAGWRRGLVATLALLSTLALVAFVIPVGLKWQEQQAGIGRAHARASTRATRTTRSELEAVPLAPSADTQPTASPQTTFDTTPAAPLSPSTAPEATTAVAQPESTPAEPAPTPAMISSAMVAAPGTPTASEDELRSAAARSVEGWAALAERYPSDPRVLRSLVLAHASRAAELGDAMAVTRRLLQVSPEQATNADVQYLVLKAAEAKGTPALLAWRILSQDMGSVGPDLLYNLELTKPKLAARAGQLLNDPAVRQHTSPTLAIARELRQAPSCAARLPLLERAVEVGDERSVAALGALSTGTARGCSKNKRKPCPPACPDQIEAFKNAMTQIALRQKSQQSGLAHMTR